MKFKSNFLRTYMSVAPLALAFERVLECHLYEGREFPAPVLDIGCGEGLFAHVLFADKVDTGIDPNPSELSRARELGGYNELIQCSGASIAKPDGAYRTIFSNSVLEHIPDLVPVLKEAHRLLAPGGRFYFTVPSEKFDQYSVVARLLSGIGMRQLSERYGKFYNRFWRHYHYYPIEKWRNLAESCGFEVVESFSYASKGICLLNDALVPVSLPRLLIKRLFNRWVLFPDIRRLLMYPAYLVVRNAISDGGKDENGGLVFMALTKR